METLETLEGNTKTSKVTKEQQEKEDLETNSSKLRCVPSKKWTLTAYNNEIETLLNAIPNDPKIKYYALGNELCPQTNKKHLQGFIETYEKMRPLEHFKTKDTHWEKAKGDNDSNLKYCTKGGDYITNMKFEKPVREPLKDPMEPHLGNLRPFQKEIVEIIKGPVDDRKIYWYWEETGHVGKSYFTKHLCMKYRALAINGQKKDIMFAVTEWLKVEDLKICIYDIPRKQGNKVSYSLVEEIKNGLFFSGKYESGMTMFNSPHLIVFSNSPPDTSNLSEDRWVVKEIGKDV